MASKTASEILKASDLTFKQQRLILKQMQDRNLSDKQFNEELKGRIKRQEDINTGMDEIRNIEGITVDGETKEQYMKRREKEKKLLNLYKGGVVNIVDAGKYFKHK